MAALSGYPGWSAVSLWRDHRNVQSTEELVFPLVFLEDLVLNRKTKTNSRDFLSWVYFKNMVRLYCHVHILTYF